MKQPLQLNVTQPCHEDWKAMTPKDQGRFCASCSKIVVDFSVMTDRQILDYFSNYTGSTCGRFTSDQLNRKITPEVQKPKNWFRYALGFMLPALLVANKSYTQGDVRAKEKSSTAASVKQKKQKKEKRNFTAPPVEEIMGEFAGPVEWLPKRDTVSFPADRVDSIAPLEETFIRDKVLEQVYSGSDDAGIICETVVLGFTVAEVVIIEEPVFHQFKRFVTDTLTGQSLKLYPNPVRPGAVMNISYKLDKGNHYIQVLDMNGRVVQQEVVNNSGNEINVPVRLYSHLTKGQYMILIANDKRRKIASKPFIVL